MARTIKQKPVQRTHFTPLIRALLTLALLSFTGCGKRTHNGGEDGGPSLDSAAAVDSQPITADAGTLPDAPSSSACIVAVRFPSCCPQVVAVTEKQLAADPCLLRWPETKRPAQCQQICKALCSVPKELSRLAAPADNGTCRFVDECQSPSDCKVGSNFLACCDCGDAYPKRFLNEHPCYHGDGQGCTNKCPPGSPQCDCAAPSGRLTCKIGDALNRCALQPD